ncbi:hypothetical protein POTOM_004757 [Populus tomentosa]|uniref:Uncharacterized protein n=1 Tax=Populus tomentosa TaxID=118781 RepID=A0A8X8AVS5_POPTO|nr:hypothetical protein POTOM_004757 [Populus tomentosa]
MEEKPFYFAISKQYEPDYRKFYLVTTEKSEVNYISATGDPSFLPLLLRFSNIMTTAQQKLVLFSSLLPPLNEGKLIRQDCILKRESWSIRISNQHHNVELIEVSNYMEIRCNQSWAQETSWYTEACQFTPREPFLTNCGAQDLEPNEGFYEVTKLCGSQHLHRLKIGPYVHDKQEEQLK